MKNKNIVKSIVSDFISAQSAKPVPKITDFVSPAFIAKVSMQNAIKEVLSAKK